MYNTKYKCRYHKNDIILETDEVTNNEKDYIRDILYREDILNIFTVDHNDDFEIFNKIIPELYKKLCNSKEFKECMKISASKMFSDDEELGLCILFSFDFMYITHKCISEYLETGTICEESMKLLNDKLTEN